MRGADFSYKGNAFPFCVYVYVGRADTPTTEYIMPSCITEQTGVLLEEAVLELTSLFAPYVVHSVVRADLRNMI